MTQPHAPRRFGDNPIERFDDDGLDRKASVQALNQLLTQDDLDTPLSLGIYGGWGSGKTSVMKMLSESMEVWDGVCVWLDAWRYAGDGPALWRALFLALVEKLRTKATFTSRKDEDAFTEQMDRVVSSLYRSAEYVDRTTTSLNWKALIPLMGKIALVPFLGALGTKTVEAMQTALGKGEDFERLANFLQTAEEKSYREHINSLEQFPIEFRRLVETHITAKGRRLYVFIDDLDRCLPEAAVGALEAIKLFLDLGDCVFVLGMDRAVVEQGIRVRYGAMPGIDAGQYLDKIIQIPFQLPPLRDQAIIRFIEGWCDANGCPELKPCAKIIAIGTEPNPRTVKRTMNVLRLIRELGRTANLWDDAHQLAMARMVVIQMSYPDFYKHLVEDPGLLARAERAEDGYPQRLLDMLGLPEGRLTGVVNSMELIRKLIHLTQLAAPSQGG